MKLREKRPKTIWIMMYRRITFLSVNHFLKRKILKFLLSMNVTNVENVLTPSKKLKDHLRKVHSERRCCYLCGKMYGNESNLNRHIDNFHGSKKSVFQYCGNYFKAYNSEFLKIHKLRCHKKFKSSKKINRMTG